MKRGATAALLAVLLLAGCGASVRAGVVVERDFDPQHCDTTLLPIGYKGSLVPVTDCYPDDWSLKLEDSTGETGWVHVSEKVYDAQPVGSRYDAGPS